MALSVSEQLSEGLPVALACHRFLVNLGAIIIIIVGA